MVAAIVPLPWYKRGQAPSRAASLRNRRIADRRLRLRGVSLTACERGVLVGSRQCEAGGYRERAGRKQRAVTFEGLEPYIADCRVRPNLQLKRQVVLNMLIHAEETAEEQ